MRIIPRINGAPTISKRRTGVLKVNYQEIVEQQIQLWTQIISELTQESPKHEAQTILNYWISQKKEEN